MIGANQSVVVFTSGRFLLNEQEKVKKVPFIMRADVVLQAIVANVYKVHNYVPGMAIKCFTLFI